MQNGITDIGKELVRHSKETEDFSARGLLSQMFPFIFEASKRMSSRAISRWLKESHGIKISDVSIAKALRNPEKYWSELAELVDPLARAVEVGTKVPMKQFLFNDDLFQMISGDKDAVYQNVDGNSPEEIEDEVRHVGFAMQNLREIWFPLAPSVRSLVWSFLAPSDLPERDEDAPQGRPKISKA